MEPPHVVRKWDAEIRIEALSRGQKLWRVTEVPFADAHGRVAGLLQHFGDRDLVGMQAEFGVGKRISRHAHAGRVAAGHQLRARRRAYRCAVEAVESCAL